MAIKINYNFKGIEVKDAYIRVDRLWGSSKEGWTGLVGVYTQTKEIIPSVEKVKQVGFPDETNYVAPIEAKESYEGTIDSLIEEFNFQAPFKEGERGYKTIYEALMAKYGGVEV